MGALLGLGAAARAVAEDGADPARFGLPATAREVVGARTQVTKTFALGGGRHATVSDGRPQHYRDETTGEWQEIAVVDEPSGPGGRRYRRLPSSTASSSRPRSSPNSRSPSGASKGHRGVHRRV